MDNVTLSDTGLRLGEGAIGGLIPTSLMILLVAILRIIKLYQQRRPYKRNPDTDYQLAVWNCNTRSPV